MQKVPDFSKKNTEIMCMKFQSLFHSLLGSISPFLHSTNSLWDSVNFSFSRRYYFNVSNNKTSIVLLKIKNFEIFSKNVYRTITLYCTVFQQKSFHKFFKI